MFENAPTTMCLEINSRRFPLEPGQLYLLGKETGENKNFDNKCFIKLENEDNVNQKHCVIDVGHSDNIYIYDLFSSQGTWLNSNLIKSLEKIRLKNGDVIKVGQQEIKFYHQQLEVSHDSSGFLEVNKNTSGIITSSPEPTSQFKNNGSTNLNNNNFLVPHIPSRKSAGTPNTSIVRAEFENDKLRNSLNVSSDTSNRRSDSFTIPETQFCKPRASFNGSDYSIAESLPEANASKIKFNFGTLDDDDDEFCIPETQEAIPVSSSQKQRLLSKGRKSQEQTVVEERSAELEAEDSAKETDGSQFRICTQDYNEGFGEETANLHSQIIPLIKHNIVVLNKSSVPVKDTSKSQTELEIDKEISAVKWSANKGDQETTNLRPDCSTPDLFDFDDMEQNKQPRANEQTTTVMPNVVQEDEEDLLPTQVFTLEKSGPTDKKTLNIVDKPCLGKENEEILTLSDKENRCPIILDPVTDFSPTQLFASNEASTARSAFSNSSRSSTSSATKTHCFTVPATVPSTSDKSAENKNNPTTLLNLDLDDEDDILTQAFLLPSKPAITSTKTSNKNVPVKCFNSTLLDGKSMDKNPVTFFAELDQAPLKQVCTTTTTDTFKIPDKEFLIPRKVTLASNTSSENDLDLLMCTPQIIKQHIQVDKEDDLRRNILAAKNKYIFGDDTDEEETNDGQTDLVKLINVPKDSKDFDKLLPHLKNEKEEIKKKDNEEQKLAKEALKKYKFNIPFGKELEAHQPVTSKSNKPSRDERHMARDREREQKEKNIKKDLKEKTVEKNESGKQGRTTRKRNKSEVVEDAEVKKSKDTKQNKSSEKEKKSSEEDSKKKSKETKVNNLKNDRTVEDNNKSMDTHIVNSKKKRETRAKKVEEKQTKKSEKEINNSSRCEEAEKQTPVRRMTRSKSINENKASTSADDINKSKTKLSNNEKEWGDDMDSVSTQPFVRVRRGRSRSKNSESQDTLASNSSLSKSTLNGRQTSLSYDTPLNGSVTEALTERKRKAEPTLAQPPAKVERKRLRSTHSLDSISSSLTSSHAAGNICISMTMVDPELFKELVKNSNGLWNIAKNPAESDILVIDKAFRTFKFLLAVARGIPIVTTDYLRKLNEMQSIKKVPIIDYLFSDPEFEKKHRFSLVKSLQMAKRQKLFKGYEFLMTTNIVPNPSELKAIIEASGGLVHYKSPPEPKEGQKIYLVSSADDKKEWHKYRRLNKNIVIVSTEAIMSAIMRQTCACISNYELA